MVSVCDLDRIDQNFEFILRRDPGARCDHAGTQGDKWFRSMYKLCFLYHVPIQIMNVGNIENVITEIWHLFIDQYS